MPLKNPKRNFKCQGLSDPLKYGDLPNKSSLNILAKERSHLKSSTPKNSKSVEEEYKNNELINNDYASEEILSGEHGNETDLSDAQRKIRNERKNLKEKNKIYIRNLIDLNLINLHLKKLREQMSDQTIQNSKKNQRTLLKLKNKRDMLREEISANLEKHTLALQQQIVENYKTHSEIEHARNFANAIAPAISTINNLHTTLTGLGSISWSNPFTSTYDYDISTQTNMLSDLRNDLRENYQFFEEDFANSFNQSQLNSFTEKISVDSLMAQINNERLQILLGDGASDGCVHAANMHAQEFANWIKSTLNCNLSPILAKDLQNQLQINNILSASDSLIGELSKPLQLSVISNFATSGKQLNENLPELLFKPKYGDDDDNKK